MKHAHHLGHQTFIQRGKPSMQSRVFNIHLLITDTLILPFFLTGIKQSSSWFLNVVTCDYLKYCLCVLQHTSILSTTTQTKIGGRTSHRRMVQSKRWCPSPEPTQTAEMHPPIKSFATQIKKQAAAKTRLRNVFSQNRPISFFCSRCKQRLGFSTQIHRCC